MTTEQDRRLLDDARRLLTDGDVRALSFTDPGTKGTKDEPESDGGLSPWEGLTDSEGSPVAKNERSGGSFGLGKYAPLAATPLRTVLYSTRYQDAAGGTHTRFRGRAVLVTHEGPDGRQKSADGYLGDGTGKRSLQGEEIPSRFRMDKVGTRILIPGWEPSGGDNWRVSAVWSIVGSYFYAVLKGRLEAVLEGDSGDERASVVSSETILPGGDVYKLLQERGNKETKTTARYVLVAAKPPVAKTHIPGIGKAVLRIDVGPDNGRRDLALVRWPGLKVTDRAGQLGEANPRIPYGWERFTAVVATEPVEDDDWVLRACENPRHDGLSVSQIPKSQQRRRRTARSALRELRKWMYQEIRSRAQRVGDSAADDAHELLDFGLSVKRDGAGSAGVRLLRTRRVRRRPPAPTVPSVDVPSLPSDVDDETSEELSEGQHERQGPTGSQSRSRTAAGTRSGTAVRNSRTGATIGWNTARESNTAARLWWLYEYARSADEHSEHPTDVLLSTMADNVNFYHPLLKHPYLMASDRIRAAVLDVSIRRGLAQQNNTSETNRMLRALNQLAGAVSLDILDNEALLDRIERVMPPKAGGIRTPRS